MKYNGDNTHCNGICLLFVYIQVYYINQIQIKHCKLYEFHQDTVKCSKIVYT